MPRGRKSTFKPEFVEQARKLSELGATDREMAHFFGITEAGFNKWKLKHPDLVASLKVGKAVSDERVEQSLYRRATGYSHDAVKILQYQGKVIVEPYVEHVPPDVVACIFWLKNRRPDLWRDRVDINGKVDHQHQFASAFARVMGASTEESQDAGQTQH